MRQGATSGSRVVLRRLEIAPFLIAGIWIVGIAAWLVLWWPVPLPELLAGTAMSVALLVTCYLWGPTAYVRIESRTVTVANAFRSYEIPRHLVSALGGYENSGVFIYTANGRDVRVGAFEMALSDTFRSERAYRLRGVALERALESIPMAPSVGSVVTVWRRTNVLLAGFAGVAFLYLVLEFFVFKTVA